jgi:hypothetical protein
MSKNESQELTLAILKALHAIAEHMESWSLFYFLRERGFRVSASTIGRRLRDLEKRKLLDKVSGTGRDITPEGVKLLQKAALDYRFTLQLKESSGCSRAIAERTDILEQLIVRQIIETERTGLAAVSALRRVIVKLLQSVEKQKSRSPRESLGSERMLIFT